MSFIMRKLRLIKNTMIKSPQKKCYTVNQDVSSQVSIVSAPEGASYHKYIDLTSLFTLVPISCAH